MKKTPRHFDVGSCTFPPDPSHGITDCLEETDNDKVDVVEQKVSYFFFSSLRVLGLLVGLLRIDFCLCNFEEPPTLENSVGQERKSSPKKG